MMAWSDPAGGIAVLTSSSTLPRRSAPEQGTGPDTAHRSIKLRLLDRRTAPVSTAAIRLQRKMKKIALLDWDGTLRQGFTIADWCRCLCDAGLLRPTLLEELDSQFDGYLRRAMSHDELAVAVAEIVSSGLCGLCVEEVGAATQEFVRTDRGSLFPYGIDALADLARLGYSAYLVSGAPGGVVRSYALPNELKLAFYCLEFVSEGNVYTGEIETNPGIASVKNGLINAIMSTATKNTFVLALGNSQSDLPLFRSANVSLVIDNKDLAVDGLARYTFSDECWPDVVADLKCMGVHL